MNLIYIYKYVYYETTQITAEKELAKSIDLNFLKKGSLFVMFLIIAIFFIICISKAIYKKIKSQTNKRLEDIKTIKNKICKNIQTAYEKFGNGMCPQSEFEWCKEYLCQKETKSWYYTFINTFGNLSYAFIGGFAGTMFHNFDLENINRYLFTILIIWIILSIFIQSIQNESNKEGYIKALTYEQYKDWYNNQNKNNNVIKLINCNK